MDKGRKRFLSMALALFMAVYLWVPAFAAEAAGQAVKLTIIHVNDVHARVDGEAIVSKIKKDREAAGEAVLLFNAGDALHGQPFATISQGESIVQVMNAVGYDAMAPGNHDFNYGLQRLQELEAEMDFPLLAANVIGKGTGKAVFKPYVVKDIAGVKVGIFGLATPETATKTNPKNVEAVTFGDPAAAAEKAVAALQGEGAEVIVGIVHLGVDDATKEAYQSDYLPEKVDGIDVIIDGHSHTEMENGMLINDTLIAQAGEYINNIGVVELVISEGVVDEKTASLIPVADDEGTPLLEADTDILKAIDTINEENKAMMEEVIAYTPYDLQGEREYVRKSETNLANLITDAMLHETGADIAITNGGGIRASISAGEIKKGDILTVLPFGNYIVAMDITGADVLEALEIGVSAYPEPAGSFSQVAGVRFTFDPDKAEGSKVIEAVIEKTGEALDPAKTYRVATNDFMAIGGDGYTMLSSKENYNEYGALDEALIQYLQAGGEIMKEPKGRVQPAAVEANQAEPAPVAEDPPVSVSVEEEPVLSIARIPEPSPMPPASVTVIAVPALAEGQLYTVQPGDSLWKLSKQYNTTWQKLAEINQIANPQLIYVGQALIVQ